MGPGARGDPPFESRGSDRRIDRVVMELYPHPSQVIDRGGGLDLERAPERRQARESSDLCAQGAVERGASHL